LALNKSSPINISRSFYLVSFLLILCLLNLKCPAGLKQAGKERLSKVVMGYYPYWEKGAFNHSKINYRYLTHIAHAFTKPDSDGNLIVDEDYIYPELVREAHKHGVKIIMSTGGWERCEGFPGMASSAENRERFIDQVIGFCKKHDYDGVDIDWEYVSNQEEQKNFVLLIEELSKALREFNPPLQLSMAVPSGHFRGRWINYEELIDEFDYISFMTYDYHGQWIYHSGHNSPLYTCNNDPCGSMNGTYSYSQLRRIPQEKLLLGIPFYGRSFDCEDLYQRFQKSQSYGYREVRKLFEFGWERVWDDCAEVPYLRSPERTEIICYDDARSVSLKCRFVKEKKAAGIIIWDLSGDYDQGTSVLLDVVGKEFR
jgi:chitinase